MASISAIDFIEIDATPAHIFDVVSDYAKIERWAGDYNCHLINGDIFQEGLLVQHHPNKMTSFVRRIDKIVPGQAIFESYIEGDLKGTGVWRFEPQANGLTKASFDCQVAANKWIIALAFKLTGAKTHSDVYAKMLRGLKDYCETSAAQERSK